MERRRRWGPSPHKVSWAELCERMSAENSSRATKISSSPLFMSSQIIKSFEYSPDLKDRYNQILLALRPEDAIHIPQLRFDYDTGKIIEWNRSLCDLTGISAAQVVGKPYAEVLDEWIPNLTKEYKRAAVEWATQKEEHVSEYEDGEDCREDYLFPLPLPIRYDSSFKYVSGNRHYDEYIELLAARTDRLINVYPKFRHRVLQYDAKTDGWNFDTTGWVGGVEFTLRRKQYVPSLQTLCKELLPKGHHAFNEDGSLAVTKPDPDNSEEQVPRTPEEIYTTISNYMRSCGPIGIDYIREILNSVCKKTRNWGMRTRSFYFSNDWSSHPETSKIHKYVLLALGGAEMITEKIEKGKLTWTLAYASSKEEERALGGEAPSKSELNRMKQKRHSKIDWEWKKFKTFLIPVFAENKNVPITCGASDSTFVFPTANRPDRTLLTLKVEGHESSDGYYGKEKFKATATVQVPASLNFFQLHRVICQLMSCGPYGTRETHEWRVPNIASDFERPLTDEKLKYVQIGETYFVDHGRRADEDFDQSCLFDKGVAIRQRVSRTGAFVDQDMPLFVEDGLELRIFRKNFGQIKACIHSTCINSVFFQPGTMALLQLGLVNYFTSYSITCTKSEEYVGPLPLNPNINVMQPQCLRGKPEEDDEHWSVEKANKQLLSDRGCLRRNLCKIGSTDYLVQMPWCSLQVSEINRLVGEEPADIAYPVSVHLTGLDHYPMFLYGQPPLPSSEDYEDYVSSMRGRIDPNFLPENIMGKGGIFSVPFRYGNPDHFYDYFYDSDNNDGSSGRDLGIGQVWTREVDEEMARIDSLQPKK